MNSKVNIHDYLSCQNIYDLCKQIDLPDEVTKNVLKHIENDDFTSVNPYFGDIFLSKTAGRSVEQIEALCSENGGFIHCGYKIMAVFLVAALHTRKLYAKAGIDDVVYMATMSFFKRTVKEYKEINGVYGFDRTFWWWRQLSLNIFRLGSLEFEIRIAEDTARIGFPGEKNIPVIGVHIPSDAVLTREELDNSYKTARAFFCKHYACFKYRCLCICYGTWLLWPALKEILPQDSKILEFQSDFAITKIYNNDQSYLAWVFKQKEKPADLNALPENTSLQRAFKKHLIKGGTIGWATGVLVR